MAKLYSPTERKSRSSILHHKSDSVEKADIERMQSEKKCEDLAGELWSLEKRLMEPQSRLLKHTAGILQMTHKGPKKGARGAGAQQNGIPGSPESMYTYHNARHSMEPVDEMFFDERSLYRSADHLDAFGEFGRDSPPPRAQGREQMQMIAKTEQTLEDLNKRLREVIIKANPQKQNTYELPPLAKTNEQGRPTDPGETLQSHLDYLEKSISEIDHEHSQSARYQLEQERAMEETVEGLNREIRGLLLPYDPNHREPPELTGSGLKQQLLYFQDAVGAVEMELSSNARKNGMQDNVEQMETVLIGLWDIIQAGEQDIRKRKQERRAARTVQGLPPDAEDDSPDEEGDYDEPFSLQAFSAKVQRLYSQATRLKDQKTVLQRQIKQQRELNSRSDATKDAEMQSKVQELERVKALLVRTETDADHVREQLSEVMEKLEAHDQERSGNESTQAELEMRNARINDLEEQLQELKDDHNIHNAEIQTKISDYESKIQILTAEVAAAVASQVAAQTSVQAKEQEMEGMNMELARLQTEVTIARAELDGAYGTRAQRAAEVAANPVIQKEIDDLTKSNDLLAAEIAQLKNGGGSGGEKVKELKKELQEVVEEYERMTKEGIEWEKEREKMEAEIDRLREERERMEGELSDEKVRWLGVSPGGENGVREGTSTGVLKAEFKKMMRDTRAEGLRALRVCLCFTFPFFILLKGRRLTGLEHQLTVDAGRTS